MSARQLVGLVLLGAAGWALAKRFQVLPQPATSIRPAGGAPGGALAPSDSYAAQTARRESAGQLFAKNPRSSASGKYQFTKATWQKVGGAWGPDPSKPFGGLTPSEAEQDRRFALLTSGNRAGLVAAGVGISSATLYAAHFLGLPTAIRVLTSPASTKLTVLLSSQVLAANPHLRGFTVADFVQWLRGRA